MSPTVNLAYWFLVAVSVVIVVAGLLFFVYLLSKEIQARRQLAEFQRQAADARRRDAYVGLHSIDRDTLVLPVAALEAALAQQLEVTA